MSGSPVVQTAEVSDRARVTQVGGDYEEHHHRYERGWQYLRGFGVDAAEMDLAEHAFVDAAAPGGRGQAAQAVDDLRRSHGRGHALVLCGASGTGRRTAALHVLLKAGVPGRKIQWLVLDWDQPRTEQIPYTPGHGFVLDLTGRPELDETFYTGLGDYQKAAESAGAFLIILADSAGWNPEVLGSVPVIFLSRPSALQVAAAHLERRAKERAGWLTGAPLDTLLSEDSPAGNGARLASLIVRAETDDKTAISNQFTDWQKHLKGWFAAHSGDDDLRERALLVAAALLENTPADIVLDAADQLFREVGGALPAGGALAGRDLQARLEAISAGTVGNENISLAKDRPGLPDAVLRYVWQQRPQLRHVLLEWASQISAPNGIAVRHLPRIADALVQLSLMPGGSVVLPVACAWIETGRPAHRQLALGILESMALHPDTGADVRKQLYDWAQQKSLSPDLAQAVAEICGGPLGRRYPRIALTRLRLLASRTDRLAVDWVAAAVRSLAAVPEQRGPVLSEVIAWAESEDSTRRMAGARTFLALANICGGILLPDSSPWSLGEGAAGAMEDTFFVRGWLAALTEPSTADDAHVSLAAWLDSASVPDEQVMPLAAAVLRGHLHGAHTAELLVGSPGASDLGRTRRKTLLNQLVDEQAPPGAALGDGTPDIEGGLRPFAG
ncbi:hypothetical protein [Streptomyces zhihengii]